MKKTAIGAEVISHQESPSETEAPGAPDGQSEMPMELSPSAQTLPILQSIQQAPQVQQTPRAEPVEQVPEGQQGQQVQNVQQVQQVQDLQQVQEVLAAEEAPHGQPNILIRKIIFRFLLGWLASILLLIVIAFSADIDWAKPFLQRGLSIIIHRKVSLGHLSWFWRPGNLTIETTRVSITDNFGAKLLSTGPSQVGLAFFPLLKKNVVIKHITLSKPEFWAVRMKDKAWNFDDLLTLGPDIQFIQTDNGTVHVVDGVDINHPKWQQLTF